MDHVAARQFSDRKMRSPAVGARGDVNEPANLPSRQVADIANSHVALGISRRVERIDPQGIAVMVRTLDDFGIALLRAHAVAERGVQLMTAAPQKPGENCQEHTEDRDDKYRAPNVADKPV